MKVWSQSFMTLMIIILAIKLLPFLMQIPELKNVNRKVLADITTSMESLLRYGSHL